MSAWDALHPASGSLHPPGSPVAYLSRSLTSGSGKGFLFLLVFLFSPQGPLLPAASLRGGNCSSVPRCQVWRPEKVKGSGSPPTASEPAAAVGHKAQVRRWPALAARSPNILAKPVN